MRLGALVIMCLEMVSTRRRAPRKPVNGVRLSNCQKTLLSIQALCCLSQHGDVLKSEFITKKISKVEHEEVLLTQQRRFLIAGIGTITSDAESLTVYVERRPRQ